MAGEYREHAQCYLCQNRCRVTMVCDMQTIVTAVWRNVPAHNAMLQRPCAKHNLDKTVGLSFEDAIRLIHALKRAHKTEAKQ